MARYVGGVRAELGALRGTFGSPSYHVTRKEVIQHDLIRGMNFF